jgi:hypothetical protein
MRGTWRRQCRLTQAVETLEPPCPGEQRPPERAGTFLCAGLGNALHDVLATVDGDSDGMDIAVVETLVKRVKHSNDLLILL